MTNGLLHNKFQTVHNKRKEWLPKSKSHLRIWLGINWSIKKKTAYFRHQRKKKEIAQRKKANKEGPPSEILALEMILKRCLIVLIALRNRRDLMKMNCKWSLEILITPKRKEIPGSNFFSKSQNWPKNVKQT